MSKFEHSQLSSLFKIYASSDIRNTYVHLNVEIKNDYYACSNTLLTTGQFLFLDRSKDFFSIGYNN